jgi:hypothetical protein
MRRRRHFRQFPRGEYMKYLDRLIEQNRRKRTPAPDIYDEKFRNEAMKDQPLKKAA